MQPLGCGGGDDMATTPAEDRKISIGRVVSRGFDTLGRNAPAFIGLAMLFGGVPSFISQYLLLGAMDPADPLATFTPAYFLSLLLMVIASYFLQAALVRSAILDLSGRPAEVGRSLAIALRLILPMIGLGIVSYFLIMLGLFLLIVPGVIAYLMLIVAVPALIEERRGVFASMSRSRELTKGSRWQIFGLLILFILVYGVSVIVLGLVVGAPGAGPGQVSIAAPIADAAVATVTILVMAVMLASLYLELRTVKEGATTDGLAAIFE